MDEAKKEAAENAASRAGRFTKLAKAIDGWLTRDSDGYITFHTGKPWMEVSTTTNRQNEGKTEIEVLWCSAGKRFPMGYDGEEPFEYPDVKQESPLSAQMELWIPNLN